MAPGTIDQIISGPVRWLNDVWDIVQQGVSGESVSDDAERMAERKAHQAIGKMTQNLENFKFNGAVANLMEFRNDLKAAIKAGISQECFAETISVMLRLMAPIVPHIAEELWAQMGWDYSVHTQAWPAYDAEKAKEDEVALVVMINGKPRENVMVSPEISEDEAKTAALATETAQKSLNGDTPKRVSSSFPDVVAKNRKSTSSCNIKRTVTAWIIFYAPHLLVALQNSVVTSFLVKRDTIYRVPTYHNNFVGTAYMPSVAINVDTTRLCTINLWVFVVQISQSTSFLISSRS